MITKWFSRTAPSPVPHDLYGSVVAQSREPAFYSELGLPDTVTGRFDLLCLHLFLLTHRLSRSDREEAKPLAQDTFDVFVEELDRALREIGIGDTTVSKRKKSMMHGYYAQIELFDAPLSADDEKELTRRVDDRFFGSQVNDASRRLTAYMRQARDELAAQSFDELLRGKLTWPPVEFTRADN